MSLFNKFVFLQADLISADDKYSFTKSFITFSSLLTEGFKFSNVSKFFSLLFFINQSIFIFKNSSEFKFFLGGYAFVNNI